MMPNCENKTSETKYYERWSQQKSEAVGSDFALQMRHTITASSVKMQNSV